MNRKCVGSSLISNIGDITLLKFRRVLTSTLDSAEDTGVLEGVQLKVLLLLVIRLSWKSLFLEDVSHISCEWLFYMS